MEDIENLEEEIRWFMAWQAEKLRRERIEERARQKVEQWQIENLCLANIDARSRGHIAFLGEYEYFFAIQDGGDVLRALRLEPIQKNGQRSMPFYEIFNIPFCLDTDLLDPDGRCPQELVHYVLTHPEEVYQAKVEVDDICSYFRTMLIRKARSMRHPDLDLQELEEL